MFMGNRGILHDKNEVIQRNWKLKAWIICLLEFRGRKRRIFSPGHYTELFFLDEATAMSAGHRPCGECRYKDYIKFKHLWVQTNRELLKTDHPLIKDIDQIIHRHRLDPHKKKIVFEDKLRNIPDGVFIKRHHDDRFYLVLDGYIYEWSPNGYVSKKPKNANEAVWVFTPKSIVKTIKAGYEVIVHRSIQEI
jgi:hypothetical protein